MNDTYELQVTLRELYFLGNCLEERQASLTNHIGLCRELELDTAASEANLAIVKSALSKINAKQEEIIYG